jgi:tetratricopeptide (TPR) repeat protein
VRLHEENNILKNISRVFFTIILVVFIDAVIPVNTSEIRFFAQESESSQCRQILNKAQELYYESKFDEAVNLVKSCITGKNLSVDEKRQAYKILSQVALARGNKEKARETIRYLLKIDPDYRPTIEQEPPSYVQLVESVRAEMKTKEEEPAVKKERKGISKWWYYTAGAVVAGSAYLLINSSHDNGGKAKPLDTPPDWDKKN